MGHALHKFTSRKYAIQNIKYNVHVNKTILNDTPDKILYDAASGLLMIQDIYRPGMADFASGQFTSNIYSQHTRLTARYNISSNKLYLEDMFYLSHIAFQSTLYDRALKLLNSTITMYNKSKCLSSGRKGYCTQYNFLPTKEYYVKVHNGFLETNHQWLGKNGRAYSQTVGTGKFTTPKLNNISLKSNTAVDLPFALPCLCVLMSCACQKRKCYCIM